MKRLSLLIVSTLLSAHDISAQTRYDYSNLCSERLDRGVVAMRTAPDSVLVSWRYLPTDPHDIVFEVLRGSKVVARMG